MSHYYDIKRKNYRAVALYAGYCIRNNGSRGSPIISPVNIGIMNIEH